MLLLPLLGWLATSSAAPQQLPFASRASEAASRFPGHVLFPLSDGTHLPSPAYGVGSVYKGVNVTENVLMALRGGWRHLDNSPFYRNEQFVGDAIAGYAAENRSFDRSQLYVTTKFDGSFGTSHRTEDELDVEPALRASLARLGLDYVDLYLIHNPVFTAPDPAKVWSSMERVKGLGLARSIGVSNYDATSLETILSVADDVPVVNQVQYHGYNFAEQQPARALGLEYGMLWTAYGSLAPVTKFPDGPLTPVAECIAVRLSKEVGQPVTTAQVAFTWLRTKGIAAITTTGSAARLAQSFAPWQDGWPLLTDEEVQAYEDAGKEGPSSWRLD